MGLLDRFRRSSAPVLAQTVEPSPFVIDIDEKTADLSDKDVGNEKDSAGSESGSEKISLDGLPVLARTDESEYAALDVVADMIYRTCWPLGWMPFQQVDAEQWIDEVILGVSIRSEDGIMRSCPAEHPGLNDFEIAMERLNAAVCMKMTSRSVEFMNRFHM